MFCKYCGKEIDEDSIFCKYCGKSLTDPEADPTADSARQDESGGKGMYTLTIFRENQWYPVNPDIFVKIDGGKEYKIDLGETLQIPVEPGEHVISFSCNLRNKEVKKDFTGDVSLSMKWNRLSGAIKVD